MRILLIEDDKDLCHSLRIQLKNAGFTVDIALDGEEGLYYAKENIHDVILLDRMLPHIDGLTVLKQLRERGLHTPVILLTALGELQDKVTGLNSGADDYLVKPFAFEELLARIGSISRRPKIWQETHTLSYGDISYSHADSRLTGPLSACTLSKKEGALLEFFLSNPGQTLPRNVILSKVWGMDAEIEEGNLDNYIHFIRRRLKAVSASVIIKTVRGIGYVLEECDV